MKASTYFAAAAPYSMWYECSYMSSARMAVAPAMLCVRAMRWADVYVCMLADGVALRNRCPQGQADPRAAIAGGASGVTMARAGPHPRRARHSGQRARGTDGGTLKPGKCVASITGVCGSHRGAGVAMRSGP